MISNYSKYWATEVETQQLPRIMFMSFVLQVQRI